MAEPSVEQVAELASALSVVGRDLELARRRIPDAGRLALLLAIKERQPVRPSELAADAGVHRSAMTRQVQALEDAGYVEGTVSTEDGRSVLVALTDAGDAECRRLYDYGVGRFQLMVSGWDASAVVERLGCCRSSASPRTVSPRRCDRCVRFGEPEEVDGDRHRIGACLVTCPGLARLARGGTAVAGPACR
ncbi:MAG: MarR family winged helix-turn-helix transcriptional regulator [Nocardioidaceae bacterium]